MKFELINPVIGGTMKTTFEADTPDEAAKKFWETLSGSKMLMDNLPRFAFTLKDVDNNRLYHFLVKEKPTEDKTAEYEIQNITDQTNKNMSSDQMREFTREAQNKKNQIKSGKMTGGQRRRYDDDSSTSDDNNLENVDDYLRYIRQKSMRAPIYWWSYWPSIYKIKSVFTPVFTPTVTPYVELWVPL